MTFQIAPAYAESPLGHCKATTSYNGDLTIQELPHTTMITLRGDASVLNAAFKGALPVELPTAINTVSDSEGVSVACLSPDEWLVLAPDDAQKPVTADKLNDALGDTHGQVVDVSDYFTTIQVTGPRAADTLAKVTNFDLRDRNFKPGMATNTRAAHATITLRRLADMSKVGPCYHVIVRASMADYLWSLITNGAQEFGIAAQDPRMGETMRY